MIITRKIEIFICEDDKDLRKAYYQKLYDNRHTAVHAANYGMSQLFAFDNKLMSLTPESRKTIEFVGAKGNKCSRRNSLYTVISEMFKGKADMGMLTCLCNTIQKAYAEDKKVDPKNGKRGFFDKSLRSYKENLPMSFAADRFAHLRFTECTNKEGNKYDGCFFSLMNIPFQMYFGRDRSGNRVVIKRILQQLRYDEQQSGIEHPLLPGEKNIEPENTGYKMCISSIAFEKHVDRITGKKKEKLFLYLCLDIPKTLAKVDKDKAIYAYLGIANPIVYSCNVKAENIFDAEVQFFKIGSKEEFIYRRQQIQAAVRRCQINNKYTKGGRGRKRKCQAIERYHEKEKNYVETKLHTYSRELVNAAISNGCGTIYLVNQPEREKKAKEDNQKGEPLVLRNWSYFSLKQKIQYKAEMVGIKMEMLGKESPDDDDSDDEL